MNHEQLLKIVMEISQQMGLADCTAIELQYQCDCHLNPSAHDPLPMLCEFYMMAEHVSGQLTMMAVFRMVCCL